MASTLPRLPIFQAIASHDPKSTVVVHSESGRRFTYGELLSDVATTKDNLLAQSPSKSIQGERIAFLVENSYDYVGAQLFPLPRAGLLVVGIWQFEVID
jgi:acyl-CoA synthetase (AMP-forming)/AMP-acid ligase II